MSSCSGSVGFSRRSHPFSPAFLDELTEGRRGGTSKTARPSVPSAMPSEAPWPSDSSPQHRQHLGRDFVATEGGHRVDPLARALQGEKQLLRHGDVFTTAVRVRQAHPVPRVVAEGECPALRCEEESACLLAFATARCRSRDRIRQPFRAKTLEPGQTVGSVDRLRHHEMRAGVEFCFEPRRFVRQIGPASDRWRRRSKKLPTGRSRRPAELFHRSGRERNPTADRIDVVDG